MAAASVRKACDSSRGAYTTACCRSLPTCSASSAAVAAAAAAAAAAARALRPRGGAAASAAAACTRSVLRCLSID